MVEQIHNEEINKELEPSPELENNIEDTTLEISNNFIQDEKCNELEVKEQSSELSDFKNDEISTQNEDNQANCLALTVRKDYNLTIIKNIFTTTGRMSLKVALSTFILNILRMFF